MNENREDVQRMQKEAIRRVQEMQSRAKNSLEGRHNQENNRNMHQPHPNPPEKKNCPENKPPEQCHSDKPKENQSNIHKMHSKPEPKTSQYPSNILDSLMKNGERNLILILILILVGEDADSTIILALMYLML